MLLYHAVHYPKPEKEEHLIREMLRLGAVIERQPGVLFVNAFKNTEAGTVIAISVWESQEALQAAMPAMGEAVKNVPFDEWEAQPREIHLLHSLV